MRKFIISDIHGFGNVYYSIMSYLDNISCNEEIELYINGDLIDRGYESAEILLDVIRRIIDNKFKITYLGGNHELLMYEFYEQRKRGFLFNNWYDNGGYITNDKLIKLMNNDEEKINKVVDFISNLKIYHKFTEKINNKPIVLVHAACLDKIDDICSNRIKDNDSNTFYAVWTREHEISKFYGYTYINPCEQKVGNKEYFTIIGHTPVNNKYGFLYHKNQNYLNIDGGCAYYVSGSFNYNHFPLLEICDNYFKILTFNSDNEIVFGNYFADGKIFAYTLDELNYARSFLDNRVKIKKTLY